ncbi:MAG: diacylglycerol kinase family protein [Prolixibacteraceae bacterium]|nr:diacylglycerol kinase family protein [Prolixibacteraceae bacterium]
MEKKNKSFSFKARLISFRYAFKGIGHLFKEEHNSWIHLAITILVIIAGIWFNLSAPEWLFIIFAIGFVFVAEIFNSAVENLGDAFSTERIDKIGKSKDLAAAGVLLSAIVSALIGLIIFIPHLLSKLSI